MHWDAHHQLRGVKRVKDLRDSPTPGLDPVSRVAGPHRGRPSFVLGQLHHRSRRSIKHDVVSVDIAERGTGDTEWNSIEVDAKVVQEDENLCREA